MLFTCEYSPEMIEYSDEFLATINLHKQYISLKCWNLLLQNKTVRKSKTLCDLFRDVFDELYEMNGLDFFFNFCDMIIKVQRKNEGLEPERRIILSEEFDKEFMDIMYTAIEGTMGEYTKQIIRSRIEKGILLRGKYDDERLMRSRQ